MIKFIFFLTILGFLIHYPSFDLALYGDDWYFIYRYFTHLDPYAHINTALPGLFTYLAPYGPSIFLIGNEYRIFGNNYFFYYLVALIFKIFASYALLLVCKKITKSTLLSFLVAILFLGGFTGIQTTDWVFYSNVYLAVGLFFIGLFFQILFFEHTGKKNLLLHFIFSVLAILSAPVRLYPLIFIIPSVDLILFLSDRKSLNKKIFFLKSIFFGSIVTFFWLIGVFGSLGGRIYSPGNWSVNDFIKFATAQPDYIVKSFFYWIGTIFVPDTVISNQLHTAMLGFGLLVISIIATLKAKLERKWIIISGIIFLTFLLAMWFFSPNRLIGSADRYLLPTFAYGCLFIGIFIRNLSNIHTLKFFSYLALLTLILIHTNTTRSTYNRWLGQGRSSEYVKKIDTQIITDFSASLKPDTLIYLEGGNGNLKQSIVFGLGFRILVLTNKMDIKYHPNAYLDYKELLEAIKVRLNKGEMLDEVISRVSIYRLEDTNITNISKSFREDIRNRLTSQN